ncbi:uncharacterized protein TNCV_1441701 [Trichonephila clavipes]|uniref:Uncharacterized protein n=1 Tax=Trichonephila clavipes TaxID=2585209 RepID=A0A8X6UXG2_TRICX|nr:uncharacterized protein TNCV_1441701 [Trichonephila clavipes]
MRTRGSKSFRWRGVEIRSAVYLLKRRPRHMSVVQNYEESNKLYLSTEGSVISTALWHKWTCDAHGTHHVAALAEWSRYRIVAGLVTSSIPVPLKTRRVGERCTLNLSRAQTSFPLWGMEVRRRGYQLWCRPGHLTVIQNYEIRRQKPSCLDHIQPTPLTPLGGPQPLEKIRSTLEKSALPALDCRL